MGRENCLNLVLNRAGQKPRQHLRLCTQNINLATERSSPSLQFLHLVPTALLFAAEIPHVLLKFLTLRRYGKCCMTFASLAEYD